MHQSDIDNPSSPRWENMIESPIIEQAPSKYKLKLKYGGFFRLIKNSCRKRYCFGSQKCIYMDTHSYNLTQLVEEVKTHYPSNSDLVISIQFVDKNAMEQSFIELDSDEKYMVMLNMYENEKEVTIYAAAYKNHDANNIQHRYRINKILLSCRTWVNIKFVEAKVTFQVKKLVEEHSCTRSNKGGNKRATQGWIANAVSDKLKLDGDVSPAELRNWLMNVYNVEIPYMRVVRGMNQAYTDIYGKWDDSFMKMDDFKEELRNRNLGSVVDIDFEINGDKKRFLRFFISLAACSIGFVIGCRPYISLDACHLKGKFNGVLAAATSIDGNNSIYPVAYAVLESENTKSWTWFLESLKKAIGTPDGLVISSDMQKGLEVAITQVYPNVEHRECIRHLYSNFKKHYRGDFFHYKLWGASKAYSLSEHDRLLKEIADKSEDAITYLNTNHNKIWSRSKFGTTSKCDYITNNISEAFNYWVGTLRYKPVLDLLDAIREKIMVRFDKKRRIVGKWKGKLVPKAKNYLNTSAKNLGEYKIRRSSDNRAEVMIKGNRSEVLLDERKCSCRVWQVTGLPCIHAAAFIAYIRDDDWEKYVDPYFTIEKFKQAYALEIAPMPEKDEWIHIDTGEKIYPPIIKRPPGRQKKNRIVSPSEPKRRQRCRRCGHYGHRDKTCKNPASDDYDPYQTSTSKRRR